MVWIIIGKRRNYKLLADLLLIRNITSQSYPPLQWGRVILIQYLPPEANQNEEKLLFSKKIIFSDTELCTPLCTSTMHFPGFLALGGGGGMYDSKYDPDSEVIPKETEIGP